MLANWHVWGLYCWEAKPPSQCHITWGWTGKDSLLKVIFMLPNDTQHNYAKKDNFGIIICCPSSNLPIHCVLEDQILLVLFGQFALLALTPLAFWNVCIIYCELRLELVKNMNLWQSRVVFSSAIRYLIMPKYLFYYSNFVRFSIFRKRWTLFLILN